MTEAPLRRIIVCLLAVALFVLPALGAAADAEAAADWIGAELDSDQPAFDQFGMASARTDVIFALASAGSREGSARQALQELAGGAADFIGEAGATNPGALAKVLLAILASREDPADFVPGRDLEAELRQSQAGDGGFADDVFGHALAMIALGATLDGVPASAVDWLSARQNPDGSWPSGFGDDPTAPDVDVTALGLQAMLAAGDQGSAREAAAFLAAAQNPNGSWTDSFGLQNANSAGLAGQALRAAGRTDAADRAAGFVLSLQNEDGGIGFSPQQPESNGFATLQGVLALGGPAYHQLEVEPFADVTWDHLFAVEIDWLGDADVSRGCDPPANDRFCPDDSVTRGQMAAMLHRALGTEVAAGPAPDFTDTYDSVFTEDIQWLAATGITRGCNPPDNDRFCPDQPISRGQMAAMLHRALAG